MHECYQVLYFKIIPFFLWDELGKGAGNFIVATDEGDNLGFDTSDLEAVALPWAPIYSGVFGEVKMQSV